MNTTRRLMTLLATLTFTTTIGLAAGPYQIRRATNAGSVATAPPVATVATAPFDDSPARTSDGIDYFYGVYDAAGQALDISVQLDTVTGSVRLGFDDGIAVSAPVDASRSSVTLAPATIRADAVQAATITIVPRDGNGALLGRGLAVSIDAAILWPAKVVGTPVDRGDGSYVATATAAAPGAGQVWVTVEGVVLASAPSITATAAVPGGSLRDIAIAQIQDLTATGGLFAVLEAQAGSGSQQAASIAQALAAAKSALATLATGDLSRDDNVLKTTLDSVLQQLASVLAAPGSVSTRDTLDLMLDLLGSARLVAQYNVDLATSSCGACNGSGSPMKVCNAVAALAQADALAAGASPNWSATVDAYAWAVELSRQALQHC